MILTKLGAVLPCPSSCTSRQRIIVNPIADSDARFETLPATHTRIEPYTCALGQLWAIEERRQRKGRSGKKESANYCLRPSIVRS